MVRAMFLSLSVLLITLTSTSSVSATTPSKTYTFADLIFDSEVKRPSGQRFEVKERARFGRLSYIAPASFMGDLVESGELPVLGSSPLPQVVPTLRSRVLRTLALSARPCRLRHAPRR